MGKMKATVITHKSRYLQKIIQFRKEIKDAYYKNMKSYFTVFIPKLTPEYLKPVVMLNVSNGRSSALIRFKNPDLLAQSLKDVYDIVSDDLWSNVWENTVWHSDALTSGSPAVLDKTYYIREK